MVREFVADDSNSQQAQARTADTLWDLIGRTLSLFTPEACTDYVCHYGYNPP